MFKLFPAAWIETACDFNAIVGESLEQLVTVGIIDAAVANRLLFEITLRYYCENQFK
jgi:hypothetical protein